jgi:hypothetical protein
MNKRIILVSLAAGGLVLAQGAAASAAQQAQIDASFTGSALLHRTSAASCSANPSTAADYKCRYDTRTTFRNAQVHGVRSGALIFDRRTSTGCAKVSGYLKDVVYSNNGHFLGTYTEQVIPGDQGDSCASSRLPDVQTQLLNSNVIGGTKSYRNQKGSVISESASVSPKVQGDPTVIAGRFEAHLHK